MSFRHVRGSHEAIQVLQQREEPWNPNDTLMISYEDSSVSDEDGEGLMFHRLVSALQQECPNVKQLWFLWAMIDVPNQDAVCTFFRTVLPCLGEMHFQSCRIHPVYLDLLVVTSNRHHQLRSLAFHCTPLSSPQSASCLAELLRLGEGGGSLEKLELDFCNIDAEGCQAILQALEGNTRLRELRIAGNSSEEVNGISARALGRSKLQRLSLADVAFTKAGITTLAHELRSNRSLAYLDLAECGSFVVPTLFEELLRSFNFTICTLQINLVIPTELAPLLLLSEKIRTAHHALLRRNYHVPQLSVWSRLLAFVSSKPDVVFHFMRHGNLDLFSDHWYTINQRGRVRRRPPNDIDSFSDP